MRSALAPVFLLLLFASGAGGGSLRVDADAAYTGGFGLEVAVCVDALELPVAPGDLGGLYVACESIHAEGVAVAPAGATLRAGQMVSLGEGFSVPAGAELSAGADSALSSGFDSLRDGSPSAATGYKTRFHLDPSSLTLGSGDRVDHLSGFSQGGDLQFRLSLVPGASPGEVAIVLAGRLDGGFYAETAPGEEIPLADGWSLIQVEWRAGAGTGALTVRVNGGAPTGLTSLVNGNATLDDVRWGAVDGTVTASWGALLLDDFASFEETVQ